MIYIRQFFSFWTCRRCRTSNIVGVNICIKCGSPHLHIV